MRRNVKITLVGTLAASAILGFGGAALAAEGPGTLAQPHSTQASAQKIAVGFGGAPLYAEKDMSSRTGAILGAGTYEVTGTDGGAWYKVAQGWVNVTSGQVAVIG
ncbi:hypothetical protein [Streptomyces sp. NRRL F-2664]|uniref:hypothetical protein n=1 Tax=Streptomyces sp. NRRL F-2664 TaxID=1463842 RepID=UPI00131BA023|nr:hypothetical protein [Streptomyces sp. NRRL F-2664]